MRYYVLIILALLTAHPAAAQREPSRSDIAKIESCVKNYSKGAPQARVIGGCVGIIDGRCRNQTTIEIADCIMREAGAWDVLLNAWWTPMKARAQKAGSWDRLLASQRKWIAQKEAACRKAYDEAGGGSIRVIWGAECQRDWTAKKAVEFYYELYK